MPLFPKLIDGWIRSLASALLNGCIVVWMVVLSSGLGFTPNRVWRDAGPSIAGQLLPSLGISLGLVCLLGGGTLDKSFRKVGLIAAVLSVVLGLLFSPALAE